jgi:two-component system OmpR family sensor kinase
MFEGWPLRKRLIASSAALTAIAGLAIGGATLIGIRAYLVGQLDEELVSATHRLQSPGRGGDDMGLRLDGPGVVVGTVVAAIDRAGVVTAVYLDANASPKAFAPQQLTGIPVTDWNAEIRQVAIRGAGEYRMAAMGVSDGRTILMGLPLATIDRVVGRIGSFLVVLIAGVVALVVVAGRKSVDVALRPLERMRETAQRVSGLQLAVGNAALTERVEVDQPETEVGQLGRAFNRMLDNVDEALTARRNSEAKVRQFVADASHELRTPLTAIRGYSELTRRQKMDMSDDLRHALDRIESESVRMSALVEDLLLLARLDEGRDLDLSPLDVSKLVKDAVNDATVASPEHVWKVKTARGATIAADRDRFYQVLVNLLANARTHTPAGTIVTTTVSVTDDAVTITVADNGPGIPPEIRESLFERFARADTSRARATGSTGLGLAIVEGLVRAHKGTIVVHSEPGDTRFVVTLPRVRKA